MGRLENKVAIITGGNSGIGRATATLFCKEKAKVIIVSRRSDMNQDTVDAIMAQGGEISSISADLTTPENCKKVIETTIEKYGKIDILVNNAGIVDNNLRITRCSEEFYDKILKIDQYSVFYMSKYALEFMEKTGKGSIVNISSIGSQGINGFAYSAAKAAVNAMTKNIAILFANSEIRCNAVAPGPTPTPLNAPEALKNFDSEFADMCFKHADLSVPMPTAEDQAEAILFFASDAAKAITGQVLYVDHGQTLF
jgi:NAD(P)-dependent dehydrogenase (short-subunit alcohol dehydrogenase family)